jgi:hypothetical protein
MSDESRRVTLSKAHRGTPAGRELIELLTELSADGQVTREEMERLRAWLEVDRGVDFPACGFLYEVVETISRDGAITEEELDSLALAIERVLPPDVRLIATLKRKERRAVRRRESATKRAADRAERIEARERAKPLHRGDFIIAGARRSAERREGCESLDVGDTVILEREPDNAHDDNAILVLTDDGTELGYVPRQDARQMAPLLDSGADVKATIKKLLQTDEGHVLPVVISTILQGDHFGAASVEPGSHPQPRQPSWDFAQPPAPVATTQSAPKPARELRAGERACPYCSQPIPQDAYTCRHCLRNLPLASVQPTKSSASTLVTVTLAILLLAAAFVAFAVFLGATSTL